MPLKYRSYSLEILTSLSFCKSHQMLELQGVIKFKPLAFGKFAIPFTF